jgi:NAD(P)H-dependent FMN reductase
VDRIGIVLGSTRPNRNGEQVARWVLEVASRRDDAHFELVDLRDYPAAAPGRAAAALARSIPERAHQRMAAKIASLDGFVIVTPEYNHSTSGVAA